MRRMVIAALGIAAAGAALANDTTASTAAGGLVLQRTDTIDMVSEDLFVSADEIRVRYVFRNQSPDEIETIVAFPMPDRDLSQEWGSNVAYPSDFHTTVEGQPVHSTLERKAVVKGKDHTGLLTRLGIPIAPDNIMDATRAMDRLPKTEWARLQTLGLAGVEEFSFGGDDEPAHHLVPLWTVQDKYWWNQRFPAGRDLLVEHRYVPGVGGSVESPVAVKEYREMPEGREFRERYCVDRDFIAAVDRVASRGMRGPGMPDRRIDYILTTGANWRSPIGSFRLIVDKGKPGNLVSFCATGMKKVSPTQFEVRHENWRPTSDLHVLIIEPQRW